MHCARCGSQLPERAKYCLECGAALFTASNRTCMITVRQIGEKWSLFGKEIWQFAAICDDGSVVAISEPITITGFELYGPNEKNRKHKAAYEKLIGSLSAAGWRLNGKAGKLWYEAALLTDS